MQPLQLGHVDSVRGDTHLHQRRIFGDTISCKGSEGGPPRIFKWGFCSRPCLLCKPLTGNSGHPRSNKPIYHPLISIYPFEVQHFYSKSSQGGPRYRVFPSMRNQPFCNDFLLINFKFLLLAGSERKSVFQYVSISFTFLLPL